MTNCIRSLARYGLAIAACCAGVPSAGAQDLGASQPSHAAETQLDTDRPDFGAATTTVPPGGVVLETGYSFIHADGNTTHTYPDAVLRVGFLTNWLELRIGQSFISTESTRADGGAGVGALDLYVGAKVATNKARGLVPEGAFIVQTTLPTGSEQTTSGRVLPGAVYLAGWDVLPERLSISAALEADKAVESDGHPFVQLGHAVNARYQWTSRLKTFAEWVALHPLGAADAHLRSQHYLHPGVTWALSSRVQVDMHCYFGISPDAVGYSGGPGLSVRF